MEAEIKQRDPDKPLKFPKLMISKNHGYVVFFVSRSTGVVIAGNHKGGNEVSHDWDLQFFEDFHGSVTLTQD